MYYWYFIIEGTFLAALMAVMAALAWNNRRRQ